MVEKREPTTEDRQIDALMPRSRSWATVARVISEVLARYPEVAREIVAALRKAEL